MLKKSLLRLAPALRFPCFAWVPARALLARAFAGTTVHWTVLFIRLTQLRLQARGSSSVADPLSGTKAHRTFVSFRFALVPLLSSRSAGMHECRERTEAQKQPKQKARFFLCSIYQTLTV